MKLLSDEEIYLKAQTAAQEILRVDAHAYSRYYLARDSIEAGYKMALADLMSGPPNGYVHDSFFSEDPRERRMSIVAESMMMYETPVRVIKMEKE